METRLHLDMLSQPDGTSCGPTCLHAVYRYWGDDAPLDEVIEQTQRLENRGTLAVYLGNHALKRGYRVTIYTYNLHVFDPTWFDGSDVNLSNKLAEQMTVGQREKTRLASAAYRDFLQLGGKVLLDDLTPKLIRDQLRRGRPILTGLSSTYLYRAKREMPLTGADDDVRGEPSGHFVVLCGYNQRTNRILIADPLHPNPPFHKRHYTVPLERAVCSILLGMATYDGNLTIIEPPAAKRAPRRPTPRRALRRRR